jgi:hypothetical protein
MSAPDLAWSIHDLRSWSREVLAEQAKAGGGTEQKPDEQTC